MILTYTTATLDDDDNGICESQTPGGAGSLTLDGALVSNGVATMAEAQIITATWAGADAARTLTVTYKDADGNTATGTIAGANAMTESGAFYAKSISDISIDAASAGAIEVGVVASDGAVSKSLRVNREQADFGLGLYADVLSGTLQYSAQFSPDWPESGDWTSASYSSTADWRNTDGLTAQTVTDESNIAFPVECVRLKLDSYTSGSVTFTVQQSR